jgi:5'-3' exonuclease
MILVDGDIIVYRVAFACQKTLYHVKDITTFTGKTALNTFMKENGLKEEELEYVTEIVTEPIEIVRHTLNAVLENILTMLQDREAHTFLTGGTTFRHEIYPAYKGGRGVRPVLYQAVRDMLVQEWDAVICGGIEADDMLGKLQANDPENSIIATIDKDLDTIIGWHYNFVTQDKYFVSPDQAEVCFYTQMLTGDDSDNVCGIRGIGPAKAKKILQDKNPKDATIAAYKEFWGDDWQEVWDCNKLLLTIQGADIG